MLLRRTEETSDFTAASLLSGFTTRFRVDASFRTNLESL